jgi:UDP-N-acetylmuramyl tripeptide synthase
LYSTLGNVREGIAQIPDCRLVLNADDSLCASLGLETKNPVLYYGFKGTYRGVREATNTDAMFCIVCKAKYEYSNHIYGHLGEFQCPECGYARPESDITCTAVTRLDPAFSEIELRVGDDNFKARVNLPGVYNIYNALAAIAVGKAIGMPVEASIRAVGNFEGGFGRMETIEANGRTLNVILVKNPTGFNQVLNYLLTDDRTMCAAFVINDNYADGTDISWLWDVDFEKLAAIDKLTERIYTSGLRAEDMAVRLKYAGVPETKITVLKDYAALIDDGLALTPEGGRFYILPSYTAMLDVRKVLVKKFGLKEFWR